MRASAMNVGELARMAGSYSARVNVSSCGRPLNETAYSRPLRALKRLMSPSNRATILCSSFWKRARLCS